MPVLHLKKKKNAAAFAHGDYISSTVFITSMKVVVVAVFLWLLLIFFYPYFFFLFNL